MNRFAAVARWLPLLWLVACSPFMGPFEADAGFSVDAGDAVDAGLDGGPTPVPCLDMPPARVEAFDGVRGGEMISSGPEGPLSWSHHHYTAPMTYSEVWWPWQLPHAPNSGATIISSPPSVSHAITELSIAPIAGDALPLASDERTAWLAHDDGGVSRVLADGGLERSSTRLPEPWFFTPAAHRAAAYRASWGNVGARAALSAPPSSGRASAMAST
jgi:hypothetical protein